MTWDPTLEPGYWGRFRASSLTAADNTAIGSLTLEDSGVTLSQTAAESQPVVKTDVNGKRFLFFDGSNDVLLAENITGLLNAAPGSMIYVVLRAHTFSTTSFHYISFASTAGSAGHTRHHIRIDDAQFSSGGRRLDGDSYTGSSGGTANAIPTGIYTQTANARYELGRIASWDSGRMVIDSPFQTAGLTSATDPLRLTLGGNSTANFLGMDLYEILYFEATHTDAERAHVHSYIQDTYGHTHSDYVAAPSPVPSATLTGSWSFTGSAVGKKQPKATASGSYAFTGTAIGKRTAKATASGSYTFTGSATGKRTPKANVTGTWTYVGTATGQTPTTVPKATLTGSWAFTGTATGRRTPKATATGSYAWSTNATGKRTPKAHATGTYRWSGAATGKRRPRAKAVGTFSWVGTAIGQSGLTIVREVTITVTGPYARDTSSIGPLSRDLHSSGPRSWSHSITGPRS